MIITGAGLPLTMPEATKNYPDVALVPIVSTAKALRILCKRWKKTHGRLLMLSLLRVLFLVDIKDLNMTNVSCLKINWK